MVRRVFSIGILIFSLYSNGVAQEEESLLSAPDNWLSERLEFPLSFAPSIDLVGWEDLKFAPTWSDSTSQKFWTYTFVWYNEKAVDLSEEYLSHNMEIYFDGLMGIDAKGKETSDGPEKTICIFMNTSDGFLGKLRTHDAFFTKKELTLYVKVKEIFCADTFRQFVLFELSPKGFSDETRKLFDAVSLNDDCD